MKILQLYQELLHHPDSANIYRKLISFYKEIGYNKEAEAFQILLEVRFAEIPVLDVNSSNNCKKQ
jgi:hypothetical protein